MATKTKRPMKCQVCMREILEGTPYVRYTEPGGVTYGFKHEKCDVKTYVHKYIGGHDERVWTPQQTFKNEESYRQKGEPEYLTVIKMLTPKRVYPTGAGEESPGFSYIAYCQEATAEEIASFQARTQKP